MLLVQGNIVAFIVALLAIKLFIGFLYKEWVQNIWMVPYYRWYHHTYTRIYPVQPGDVLKVNFTRSFTRIFFLGRVDG